MYTINLPLVKKCTTHCLNGNVHNDILLLNFTWNFHNHHLSSNLRLKFDKPEGNGGGNYSNGGKTTSYT